MRTQTSTEKTQKAHRHVPVSPAKSRGLTVSKPRAKKAVQAAQIAHKEKSNDLVDVDDFDRGGDLDSSALESAFGAVDWLFGALDAGGGGDADGALHPLDDQDDLQQSLDPHAQSVDAALGYAAQVEGRRDKRVRRLNDRELTEQIQDYFGEDADTVFLAGTARRIVEKAFLENDSWCYEWLFGARVLGTDDVPSRAEVLTAFGARDLVFQTRIQYQMWLDGRRADMEFPVKGLDRFLVMRLGTLLREKNELLALDHALVILEQCWVHPGLTRQELSELYAQHIQHRPGQVIQIADMDLFDNIVRWLELDYFISINTRTGGLHFTGRNPARMLEDSRQKVTSGSLNRGWSSWW